MSTMFCSHIPNEKEDQEWIGRRGLITKNGNTATAEKFLAELSIFAVSEPESRESPNDSSVKRLESTTPEDAPSVKKEEEEVLWKAAVDPHSGRTYYYHSVTRQTQWHKPDEIRAMEKRLKLEKKRQDKLFFKEMERNIYKSLEKKERIPGVTESKHMVIPSTPAEETPSIEGTKQRVRTISGMDECMLAQLYGVKPVLSTATVATVSMVPKKTVTTTTVSFDIVGRPPLPPRVPSRADSMSLSPEERDPKFTDLNHRDSDAGAELAGEKLLDAPINEDVNLGGENVAVLKNHIRRNTGSTIYVKSTMTNPDIKATIKVSLMYAIVCE